MSNQPVSNKVYRHAGNLPVLALVPKQAATVLDVGCGAGDNARCLRERGATVDGITLSLMEAELARNCCREVWVHNLENGLPEEARGPYDAALCSHVLEHLCFPQKLLADLHRALKPGGSLVVALPNMLFYRNRLKLLRGRVEYEEGGLMDETHFRWYTFASAQRLLENAGFMRVSAAGDGSLPLPGLRRILPTGFLAPLDRTATRLLPGLFGFQLLYHYRKEAAA
ncbi:MAG TPA: class I SAM-dependent methyltransferase [Chthoniobacteraceae bacterium]